MPSALPVRLRVAVVGAGWWATRAHLPALASRRDVDVVGIVDPDAARRAVVMDHFDVPHGYADLPQLLKGLRGEIDAVLVAAPHVVHHRLAAAALDAGVHVFVEKPLALRAADAWDLVDRAARTDRHLMVGYTHQTTRAADRVREVVRGREIGDLLHVTACSATGFGVLIDEAARATDVETGLPQQPRAGTYDDATAGGGQAHAQATHGLGMIFHVTGRRPTRLAAFMHRHASGVDLVDAVAFELDGGAVGTLASTGTLQAGQTPHQELRYHGSGGHVVQDLVRGRVEVHRHGRAVEVVELPEHERCPQEAPAHRFVDLLLGRGGNPSPAWPAACAVAFVEAAHSSALAGTSVTISSQSLAEVRGCG